MSKRQRNDRLIEAAGWRLRRIREACGLSQEKVLFETNIHLSNIENGRHCEPQQKACGRKACGAADAEPKR